MSRLVYAEAAAAGIPSTNCFVSTRINTPDGGVDAKVQAGEAPIANGLLENGLNCFQVKSGGFAANDGNLRDLFQDKHGKLHPRVEECFAANGRFVVALFGHDDPTPTHAKDLGSRIKRLLANGHPAYSDARIAVLLQSQLGALIDSHKPIFLSVTQRPFQGMEPFVYWERSDEMQRGYQKDAGHESIAVPLRKAMAELSRGQHVRLTGPPGVGKTRLVLEALRPQDLASQVIYCASPQPLLASSLLAHLRGIHNKYSVIVVVDECPPETAASLWNEVQGIGPQVKLITIYSEQDDRAGSTQILAVPELKEESIEGILQSHGIPSAEIRRLALLCGGSPRVAHVIGQNYADGEIDILKVRDTNDVWARYIQSEPGEEPHTVLQFLALFRRFGNRGSNADESTQIHTMIQEKEPALSDPKFRAILDRLVKRKILQGTFTLYITPAALHVYLWRSWWETYRKPDWSPIGKLSQPLRQAYFSMFRYAEESDAARDVVRELLGPGGPFRDIAVIETEVGGPFFGALAEADPEAAIEALVRLLGPSSKAQLMNVRSARRHVVPALAQAAFEPELFEDAARLLLQLAEAENEHWSNNATGTFAGLFTNAPAGVAPSAVPPIERNKILREALHSGNEARLRVAFKALEAALEAHHFVRTVGAEYRGLRQASPSWSPQTMGEWQMGFEDAWRAGMEFVTQIPGDPQIACSSILATRSRGLISRFPALAPQVLDDLRKQASLNEETKQLVLAEVLSILHFDAKALAPHLLSALTVLQNDLTGTSFHDRIRRFVMMQPFTDNFDDEGKHRADNELAAPLVDLALAAMDSPDLLDKELAWIVRSSEFNAYVFGRELAKKDRGRILPSLRQILIQDSKAELMFVGGYLFGLRLVDSSAVERELDFACEHPMLRRRAGRLTILSGASAHGIDRLFSLADTGDCEIRTLTQLGLAELKDDEFAALFQRLLLFKPPSGAFTALDLCGLYFGGKKKRRVPSEIALQILEATVGKPESRDLNAPVMHDYHWRELALQVLETGGTQATRLGAFMVDNFGRSGTVLESDFRQSSEALNSWAKANPEAAWTAIAPKLLDRRTRIFFMWWLRHRFDHANRNESPIGFFSETMLFAWAKQDPKERAPLLLGVVPVDLEAASLATRLLSEFGASKDARAALSSNWGSGSFAGSMVSHEVIKRSKLVEWLSKATDVRVIRWLKDEIRYADRAIDNAQEFEERFF